MRLPVARLPVIRLSTARASRHPWIYRKMVRPPREPLAPGTFVEVQTREGAFAGRGIYNPRSEIALRILTEDEPEALDEAFFLSRFRAAKELREDVLRTPERADAWRLCHGEGDGLSGLVVDRFADTIVVKPYSAGYVVAADLVVGALHEIFPGCRIVFRMDATAAKREGLDAASVAKLEKRFPASGRVTIREGDLRMLVDLETGHKTGYFLDQRENRARFASLARGMRVLDCFSYTGGFAISAMLGGAVSATAVDLDEKALAVARENAELNGVDVEFVHAAVFRHLRAMIARGDEVDALVLDPAKLAAVRSELAVAKRKYGDVNRLGFRVVREGGIVLTCSSSGLVSEAEFMSIVSNSAAEAGVRLQVFEVAGAGGDHPVASDFPEGRYLKAAFARVVRKGVRKAAPEARPGPKPKPRVRAKGRGRGKRQT
ncbi:MAG: class I SAM-dependent rRNA methyltransferase [Planctomycetota bacterium]|jgi:23S rRNA (cytosine1962-C5)-methyltransferase